MLQVRLLPNIDPGQRAGIDESQISLVNLGASEPLVGVIAEELVAFDPFGLSVVSIQAIVNRQSLEDVVGTMLSLDGLEQGVNVGRSVSGRHCRPITRNGEKILKELFGTCQDDPDCKKAEAQGTKWR